MQSINLNRFPIDLVQDGSIFCIPASILGILKYHIPNINESQFSLMTKMIIYASDNMPSFNAAQNGIGPSLSAQFIFQQLNPSTFDEWANNIKSEIDNNNPIAIATRVSVGVHIRVVLGYDTSNNEFLLFNPGIEARKLLVPSQSSIVGGCVITSSGLQKYTYSEAQNDWNAPQSTRDQLKINKV